MQNQLEQLNIRNRKDKLKAQITTMTKLLSELQEQCMHPNAMYKYGADTGNWCKGDNRYWIDWRCPDCDKWWKVDATSEAYDYAREYNRIKVEKFP